MRRDLPAHRFDAFRPHAGGHRPSGIALIKYRAALAVIFRQSTPFLPSLPAPGALVAHSRPLKNRFEVALELFRIGSGSGLAAHRGACGWQWPILGRRKNRVRGSLASIKFNAVKTLLVLLAACGLLFASQRPAQAQASWGIPLPFPFLFYNFGQSYQQPYYGQGYYGGKRAYYGQRYYCGPGYCTPSRRAYFYRQYYRPRYYYRP